MKNILLSLICLTVIASVHAQDNRLSIGAENTLSFSNATSPRPNRNDNAYRAAYNAFLRTEYRISNKLSATAGFGYMQTREYVEFDFESEFDQFGVKSNKSHHYIVAPFGIKYSMGPFFIRPEVGIGINTANTHLNEFREYVSPGLSVGGTTKTKDVNNIDGVHKMTYPLFLTIGTEVPVSSFRLIFALQGYYTLNTIGEKYSNQRHAYGFGSTVGVKF